MTRHLVLIGMMGVGKSTIGRHCAARLSRPFVDTDALVEATAGATIDEIFRRDGEAMFRGLERRAVADACASPEPLVIACGGGAVLDADSRRCLRASGCVVWLEAASETLAVRVGDAASRPLLTGRAVATRLDRLAATRAPAYQAAAHRRLDTTTLDVAAVVDQTLEAFARCDD